MGGYRSLGSANLYWELNRMPVIMKTYFLFLTCFFNLGAVNLIAQESIDYRQDSAFFYRQISSYERWLSTQNLDNYFRFDETPLTIKKRRLTLNLFFLIKGVDASINGINQLNERFKTQTRFSLEEVLFQKALHYFEVLPEDLVLKVKSLPDDENQGFYGRGVDSRLRYETEGVSKNFIVTPFSTLKTEVKDTLVINNFEIPPGLFSFLQLNLDSSKIKKKERELCSHIKQKAEEYFNKKGGEFLYSFPASTNSITINVKNFKHEVLKPGWIGGLFDPNEKLTFTIKILFPENENNLLRIPMIIDGKYGQGVFKARSLDWHEMHPEYLADLDDYVKFTWKERVRTWIYEFD